MGDVYKARDLKLNRMVALKVLRPDHSGDPGRRLRFMQEAQAASALNHPNIITIHDILSEEGSEIMVMEMVAGRTLNEIIPRDGLRVAQVINYSAQIADALAAAHGAGIIHRDLKPGNIMVTDRDLVKLLDFGLAKLSPAFEVDPGATSQAPLTVQGSIVGTLCYMSPEQAQGKPVDARSDIFSFGAVLYEMATGMRAFAGDNAIGALSSVLRDEPRRVLESSPDVPPVLSDMIHRCLRKDPADRFQTMAELRDGLLRLRQLSQSGALYAQSPLAETVTVSPAPPSAPSPTKMWIYVLAGFAVFVAVIGAWFLLPHKNPEPSSPIAALPHNEPTNKPSPTAPVTPSAPPPPAVAPAKDAVVPLIPVPDGTPVPLELLANIPVDAEPGLPLQFKVTADVKVGAETVIAKGAAATGELHSREKKRQFLVVGRGAKINVRLNTVDSPDGAKLKLRDTVRAIESDGPKPKTIAVAKGAETLAHTDGPQAIRLKR
jgi:serine/threonine-protein kinase